MFKKIRLYSICALTCLLLAACGSTESSDDSSVSEKTDSVETETETESYETTLSLTEEEEDILAQMADDINVITDETYAETVIELDYHVGSFTGQVYQLQGVYSVIEDMPYVSRTLVNGEEETFCGLPMEFVNTEKDIEEGSWVEVTGIIGESEIDGETVTILQVVAIEVLDEQGEEALSWDGETAHQH